MSTQIIFLWFIVGVVIGYVVSG
ncbi:hypothetical protein TIMSHEL_64 [Mycobacterium phage Timshel]|uniref:Uncharacterized protein n=1 Tax=Mycobacterium phage Timshel TaxID=1032895 RepID=G1DB82_9CAUD|nr:hypothetical protein FDI10_gp30 [Mycobacterium phage Timshel]AEJ92370.1 hypothetical protein TIMSHEL_64 [Mycobacterium phage Timshel]